MERMERQAGLGRSLGDVLDSLTPSEPAPLTPGARALFEPEAVEERLASLSHYVDALRRRVRKLERLVPHDLLEDGRERGKAKGRGKKHKGK